MPGTKTIILSFIMILIIVASVILYQQFYPGSIGTDKPNPTPTPYTPTSTPTPTPELPDPVILHFQGDQTQVAGSFNYEEVVDATVKNEGGKGLVKVYATSSSEGTITAELELIMEQNEIIDVQLKLGQPLTFNMTWPIFNCWAEPG